ncbi:MAG: gluconate 2-dehydrogenase subunit 3 family protein, partial [Acidobacteria bacterium]|nr:gluconate 2-dehydrogenase subunit 3 family protein [Acidobacteriota bacterium]
MKTRRRFLHTAAAAGALTSCTRRQGPWRFFSEDEMTLMEAMVDTLIPPDDFPGAAEAGVAVFLDRQLAGHYRKFQPLYREELAAVGADFIKLTPEQRTARMKEIEKNHKPFFATLLSHTMQGLRRPAPRRQSRRDRLPHGRRA